MNRLFIHLFVVIVIGLFSINWLSEYLWQQWHQEQSSEHQSLIQALTALTLVTDNLTDDTLPTNTGQNNFATQSLKNIQQQLAMPVNIIKSKDIAWLEQQKQVLTHKQSLIGYDSNDNLIVYIKSKKNDNIYVFGPFKQQNNYTNNQFIKISLLILSYILLGLIIYLWTKPLWLDLNQLNEKASEISNGNIDIKPLPNPRSPIKNIVATFNSMSQRILKLISDQRQLVNDVSHELRTPLARLRFSIEMLDNVSDQQRQEMSQDLSEMSALIDEMLSYARLENLDAHSNKSDTDLNLLIKYTIEKFTRTSDISINYDLPSQYTFYCNEQLIERAIQNLLSNALRYAKNHINFTVHFDAQQLYISIEDDGKGIDESKQDKVFDAFYRIEESRNKEFGGFGLGLAIVNRICQWHGGHCQLTNSPLGGCKFTLCLPISH
ncbi:ATP-binding protein [Thalassotalea profundi]|uniref:histidine kinase n=1 Tax=Thalassotalea profundi TaxID=2036687 RepID=A0ABQ3IKE5_9GAMM|nr:ATP-binding protein [Thalassotalea profundi]GHE86415.1 hypothetical protein GCM10011501_14490 [Thalassotalea profundi]